VSHNHKEPSPNTYWTLTGAASCLVMDADLYEHLNTTITQSPQQQSGHSFSTTEAAIDEKDDANVSRNSQDSRRVRTTSVSLPEEIDQVVSVITASPWAARLGDLVGSVRKQVTPDPTRYCS